MIGRLRGALLDKRPGQVIVDAGGVGYEVTITLGAYEALGAPGGPVELHIHTQVREDAITLFGFADAREKSLFSALIAVNGIGPRLAIAALSGLGADGLIEVVRQRDAVRLSSVPGIGRKTADRVLLEVGDRLSGFDTVPSGSPGATAAGVREDVVSALTNLGYRPNVALDAVRRAGRTATPPQPGNFETLLRQSLRLLAR